MQLCWPPATTGTAEKTFLFTLNSTSRAERVLIAGVSSRCRLKPPDETQRALIRQSTTFFFFYASTYHFEVNVYCTLSSLRKNDTLRAKPKPGFYYVLCAATGTFSFFFFLFFAEMKVGTKIIRSIVLLGCCPQVTGKQME